MSASQPAAPEPHEPEHTLPEPAEASLRAVADTDEVVWHVPAPDGESAVAPTADVPAPLDPPAATTAAPAAKAPAKPRAKSTTAAKPKATAAKPKATAAKPKAAAAKPRATTAKPKATAAKPRAAAAKPKAAAAKPRAATAKATAASKATAKPNAGATPKAPAKPRAPRRKAVAWPAAAPQATPNAPVQAAPTPPVDPASAPLPRAVPDPVGPTTAPAPDPTFVPQRPTIERREHVREPERRVPAFRNPPPAQPAPPADEPAPASSEPASVAYVAPAPAAYQPPAAPAYEPTVAPQQPVPYQQPAASAQPEYQHAAPAYAPPVPAPQPAAYEQPAAHPQPAYEQPVAPAYVPPAPAPAPQPAAYQQPAAPLAPAAPQPPAPAAAPQPPVAAPPVTHREAILAEAASKAPPGFTGPAILAAESPTLLALDPVEDETTRPAPVAAEPDTIGGSALLASARNAIPRSGDTKLFGRERDATVRVALATIVATVLVVVLGPPLASAVAKLPIAGPMLDQLKTFTLYPKAYGVASVAAILGLACTTGMVYAQMEKTATKQDRRADPTVRLNIALASLITLIVTAGLFSLLKRYGWASSASALGFFLATCLLVPLGNLPGARAMRHLPARAWAGAFVLSVAALVIYPSIPGALITILTFTHVRTNWRAVSDGGDEHADGPVDGTNRKSAAMITGFVLIGAAIGMHAMTLTPDGVRGAILSSNPAIPGAAVGPDIAPPKTP